MDNILLLGAGTQGLILAKDLKKAGYHVVLHTNERHNYADDSRYVAKVYYSEMSLDNILKIVLEEEINAVIPMGDANAEFLSANRDVLLKHVKYEMPDLETFYRGYDKNRLMSVCREKGYPHPLTITDVTDVGKVANDKFTFPLLIKPNRTCGGRGMTLVTSYEELCRVFPDIYREYGECHLQAFIPEGGRQVEVQLYIDRNGSLVASSVISKFRWYPEKAGSSCCAESVRNDEIVATLHSLLKDIGWVGFADFDTIEDPRTHQLLIMELNPRVPACVKTAVVSGINWGRIIAEQYLDKPRTDYDYRPGKVLRHLGFETLWFLKSPNRFSTKPNWFKLIGRNIHYQDFDFFDQKPFWLGTIHNIRKLFDPKFRRSKAGTQTNN